MYKVYRFTNPVAYAVRVVARTEVEAWRKLYRTHAAYFCRRGWVLAV